MRIGIDDTDSPAGMCTTYIGAVLADRLRRAGMSIGDLMLVRLNPNVIHKTRGNAAICLDVEGDPELAFRMACEIVEELADFSCRDTNPGVAVAEGPLTGEFYRKAVSDFCGIEEAVGLLSREGALYRGYKNGRGLIGAAAAIACRLEDQTSEVLVYRRPELWGTPRRVDRETLFRADCETYPLTWDTVDREGDLVVCVPHTPDPVLFGIRGESAESVLRARKMVRSEEPSLEQVFTTNQGTDAHLVEGSPASLEPGRSYLISGEISSLPVTGRGGHVEVCLSWKGTRVRCMAYEPTKGFREIVRELRPGDGLVAGGSYKEGSLNLEKMMVRSVAPCSDRRPPSCPSCQRRMTSAGRDKGYKCRTCGARARDPEHLPAPRGLEPGWYEVPPSARRHLAKPLCRGTPDLERYGIR